MVESKCFGPEQLRDGPNNSTAAYTASSTDLIIVSSFSFCCMLLLLGHILRVKVK